VKCHDLAAVVARAAVVLVAADKVAPAADLEQVVQADALGVVENHQFRVQLSRSVH
jgi:hypothetical protein